jgi:hypothetical protein
MKIKILIFFCLTTVFSQKISGNEAKRFLKNKQSINNSNQLINKPNLYRIIEITLNSISVLCLLKFIGLISTLIRMDKISKLYKQQLALLKSKEIDSASSQNTQIIKLDEEYYKAEQKIGEYNKISFFIGENIQFSQKIVEINDNLKTTVFEFKIYNNKNINNKNIFYISLGQGFMEIFQEDENIQCTPVNKKCKKIQGIITGVLSSELSILDSEQNQNDENYDIKMILDDLIKIIKNENLEILTSIFSTIASDNFKNFLTRKIDLQEYYEVPTIEELEAKIEDIKEYRECKPYDKILMEKVLRRLIDIEKDYENGELDRSIANRKSFLSVEDKFKENAKKLDKHMEDKNQILLLEEKSIEKLFSKSDKILFSIFDFLAK